MADATGTKEKSEEEIADELAKSERVAKEKLERLFEEEEAEKEEKAEKKEKEEEDRERRRRNEEEEKEKEREDRHPREERSDKRLNREDLKKQISKLREKVEGFSKSEGKETAESADRFVRNSGRQPPVEPTPTESPVQAPRSFSNVFKGFKLPNIRLPGIGSFGGGAGGAVGSGAAGVGGEAATGAAVGAGGAAAAGAGGAAAGGAAAVGGGAAVAGGGAVAAGGVPVLAIVGAAVAIVAVVFLIVIMTPVIFNMFGGSGLGGTAYAGDCSNVSSTFNNPTIIDRVNANISVYKAAAAAEDVPWEMVAAVHYEETSSDPSVPNMYRFAPPPPGVDVNDFSAASRQAAKVLQGKATGGPVGRALRVDMSPSDDSNKESIKDAFWGYNGRASYQKEIAESLGFDPDTEGYEGSGYVMNRWDDQRESMTIKIFDGSGNVIEEVNLQIDGTWKVFFLLRNATYSGGQISQINDFCVGGEGDGTTPSGCPVVGTITTPYGFSIAGYPDLNGNGLNDEWHYGVDIDDPPEDTPVRTTISGIAEKGGSASAGGGFNVAVRNGEYSVVFRHMQDAGRISGQVTKGQAVGIKGNTGRASFGSHVHYEIYKGGVEQNPLNYIPKTLNFTIPADNNYSGILPTGGVWGTCNAPPSISTRINADDYFIFDGAWPDSEKDKVALAITTPIRSSTWKNLVFGRGKVRLTRDAVDESCRDVCSGVAVDLNTVKLRDLFFNLSDRGRVMVITHELTHILESRDRAAAPATLIFDRTAPYTDQYHASPAYNLEYKPNGIIRSYPLCSGFSCGRFTRIDVQAENFAEMAGIYVAPRDGVAPPVDLQNEYPEHFKFARDVLFGGTTF